MSYGYDEYDDDDYDRWEDEEEYEPDCASYHLYLCKDRKGNVYVHELTLGGWLGGLHGSFGYPDILLYEDKFSLDRCKQPLKRRLKQMDIQNGESLDITGLAGIYRNKLIRVRRLNTRGILWTKKQGRTA